MLRNVIMDILSEVSRAVKYEGALARAIEVAGDISMVRKLRAVGDAPVPGVLAAIARIHVHHLRRFPFSPRRELAGAVLAYVTCSGEQDEIMSETIHLLLKQQEGIVSLPSIDDTIAIALDRGRGRLTAESIGKADPRTYFEDTMQLRQRWQVSLGASVKKVEWIWIGQGPFIIWALRCTRVVTC